MRGSRRKEKHMYEKGFPTTSGRGRCSANFVFYIAEDNLHAADAFRPAIEKARATLEDLPEIGSPCDFDSQEVADLRMLPVPKFKNYLIFYRSTRDAVEILRVLHGARDVSSLFGE
jgi:toxin ParE1/3/4